MDRPINILFLAANPKDTPALRLDEEVRGIDLALRQSEFGDRFDIQQHWAVRVVDLQSYLLRHKPDIVHFSGHGSVSNEIFLEDLHGQSQSVSGHALGQLFSVLKDNIRCVVLNACYSEQQGQAIAEHIDCVIGMSKEIGDVASIAFSSAFYQALGYGKDVETAFNLGCIQLDLEDLDEQDTPQLIAKRCNPRDVKLVPDNPQAHAESSSQPLSPPLYPLNTVAIPTLLKAIEFLFGDGSRILEQRRERRSAEQQRTTKEIATAQALQALTAPKDVIRSKEVALSLPPVESAWLESEANIKHLLSLLEIHTKNYLLAEEQYAKWGSSLVPPIIVHNRTEAENEIAAKTKELQAALSRIYGKKVAVLEVEQA